MSISHIENTDLLPDGFDDFLPFLEWALPSANARGAKRRSSPAEETQALYDLCMTEGRVNEALKYCDRFPMGCLPPDGQRLFWITLSMAEVRPQVEYYRNSLDSVVSDVDRFPRSPESDLL